MTDRMSKSSRVSIDQRCITQRSIAQRCITQRCIAACCIALGALLLCGTVTPSTARSPRWIDRLPADDPDTVWPTEAATYQTQQFPSVQQQGSQPRPEAQPLQSAHQPPDAQQIPRRLVSDPAGTTIVLPPISSLPNPARFDPARLPDPATLADPASSAPTGIYGATTALLWSAVGVVQGVSAVTREALWETAYMFGFNTTPMPRPTEIDTVTDLSPARGLDDPSARDAAQPDMRTATPRRAPRPDGARTSPGAQNGPRLQYFAGLQAVPGLQNVPDLQNVPFGQDARGHQDSLGSQGPAAPMVRLAEVTPARQVKATDAVIGLNDTGSAAAVTPPVPAAAPIAPAPTAAAAAPPAPAATPTADPKELAAIDPGLLANFIYDRGERRPDGSFFVPKSLQRLFEIRTKRVVATEVPVAMSLAGRIVADPQYHGDVEASLLGRIEPPEGGLPVLGQTVHTGDILAYVVPAVGVVDRTQVRSQIARLTTDIRVETENLEILKQFSFVPFRDGKIYQSEQRIAGLRREREALLPLLQTQEALRASADGVISTSTAIAGRIVHPGESVFSIVNPDKLWIEALAPDPTVAESAARVQHASATTPEGQSLALTYVGSGLVLREQSAPVLFRIDNPPPGLQVGRPVTVAVQSENHSQAGLPISRDALSIGADGVQEVWEQSEPEVFLPHAVRTVDLDGRNVLVTEGLKEGARVVVTGVRLLAQLQ